MSEYDVEQWLPLRGRWLRYFWSGLLRGFLALCFLWSLCLMSNPGMRQTEKGQPGAAKTQIGNFKTAIELYRLDHNGKPPTTQQGLLALIRPPTNGSDPRWKGPYLNDVTDVPLDPWQHAYVYSCPDPEEVPYLIVSYGADGKPGGLDQAEDISSVKR